MFTRCEHQCEAGCGIYTERPSPCAAFECAWLRGDGLLQDDDRPDRMGLMVETCVSEFPGAAAIQYVQLWETRPGSLDERGSRARGLYEGLGARWPLRVQRYRGATRYEAPPHLAEVASELERRSKATQVRAEPDDPCPCGSTKSFRRCHGRA